MKCRRRRAVLRRFDAGVVHDVTHAVTSEPRNMGGVINAMAWDPSNRRLAVTFDGSAGAHSFDPWHYRLMLGSPLCPPTTSQTPLLFSHILASAPFFSHSLSLSLFLLSLACCLVVLL